jgi:mRNA interferase RelE/StbE
MKTVFRTSFARDLKKIRDNAVRIEIAAVIATVDAARGLNDLPNLKKLAGGENCYRIRIGKYRLGLTFDGETIEFVRCLLRRDLYRYFP